MTSYRQKRQVRKLQANIRKRHLQVARSVTTFRLKPRKGMTDVEGKLKFVSGLSIKKLGPPWSSDMFSKAIKFQANLRIYIHKRRSQPAVYYTMAGSSSMNAWKRTWREAHVAVSEKGAVTTEKFSEKTDTARHKHDNTVGRMSAVSSHLRCGCQPTRSEKTHAVTACSATVAVRITAIFATLAHAAPVRCSISPAGLPLSYFSVNPIRLKMTTFIKKLQIFAAKQFILRALDLGPLTVVAQDLQDDNDISNGEMVSQIEPHGRTLSQVLQEGKLLTCASKIFSLVFPDPLQMPHACHLAHF